MTAIQEASEQMTATSDDPMLEARGITHRYGAVTALSDVSITAKRGEFLTILGSSGSGKTTMLRVISGLEMPQEVAALRIDGTDVIGVPPAKRSCTTVFQSYALFPHMSVAENVAYGLKVRGTCKTEAMAEARRALGMVQLDSKADRRVGQLSGGERQRVALARAVVTRPSILLLDEPLGALDERLRQDMQFELMELQRSLGMTFVYITHSQEEALTMSDRVVLMSHGKVEQSGAPLELFDRPVSRFAAEFMGFENILPVRFIGVEGDLGLVELANGERMRAALVGAPPAAGADVCIAVRAERIWQGLGKMENSLPVSKQTRIYRGKYTDIQAETPIGTIRMRRWDGAPEAEAAGRIGWHSRDAAIVASSSGKGENFPDTTNDKRKNQQEMKT